MRQRGPESSLEPPEHEPGCTDPTVDPLSCPELLAKLPRLLSFDLAGREDRLLLRMGRWLGFHGGVSLQLLPGDRLPAVRLRAAWRLPARRLEAEIVADPRWGRWLLELQQPCAFHPGEDPASSLPGPLRRLGSEACTILPVRGDGIEPRILLLTGGPTLEEADLASLTAAAKLVSQAAEHQTRFRTTANECFALRRQAVAATQESVQLRAESNRLRRLLRLGERMEPVTAGLKELLKAAAETLASSMRAQLVALVRPRRNDVWLVGSPAEGAARHEILLRDGFMRCHLGTLDSYQVHAVDARMPLAGLEDVRGIAVACSPPTEEGDRLLVLSLGRSGFEPGEHEFVGAVAERLQRALEQREMIDQALDRSRFLERRLDQVAASYRIARTLASSVSDEEAAGRIVWDVRQSFRSDAAVLMYEVVRGAGPEAVCAVEGGVEQEREFLAWAAQEYRSRFAPGLGAELTVRRVPAVEGPSLPARNERLVAAESDPAWWPSRLVAPFSMGEGTFGLLCLGSRRPHEFGAESEAALRILAGDAAQTLGHLYGLAVRERRLLEQVVAHLPTGVLLVGPEGELRVVNEAAVTMLHLEDPRPRTLRALEERCRLGLGLLVREAQDRGEDLLNREIVWGETNPVYLRADVGLVRDPQGEGTGTLLALRDISVVKRLELEQNAFVSTVSHELKTPLTTMRTAAELMLAGEAGRVTEEQKRFLDLSLRNIERLGRLIQNLLDVAREEAGQLDLDRHELDVGEMLSEHIHALQRTAKQQDRRLRWRIDAETRGYVDPDRFPEILDNLAGNALKFTPPGGRIQIRIRRLTPCPTPEALALAEALQRPLRGFELEVADDGPGMGSDTREHAFERFYQAGDPLAGRPAGAGLGLAITRSLVRGHDGAIRIESEWGRGTTVRVWIPTSERDGRLHAAASQLGFRIADCLAHLRGGCLAAVDLGAPGEPPPSRLEERAREFLAEHRVEQATMVWPDRDWCLLVLPDGPPAETLLAGLSAAWAEDGSPPALGLARFPQEGTQVGTLLAIARERCQGPGAAGTMPADPPAPPEPGRDGSEDPSPEQVLA